MKRVRSHTFAGTRYLIEWAASLGEDKGGKSFDDVIGGLTIPPSRRGPARMFLSYALMGEQRRWALEVLIHEALHACSPKLTEKQVTAWGRSIARFLERHGATLPRDFTGLSKKEHAQVRRVRRGIKKEAR